jgi:predicted ATP-grasp superfamily ATP-dependent carboligase/protein-tyrosine-phosphatase
MKQRILIVGDELRVVLSVARSLARCNVDVILAHTIPNRFVRSRALARHVRIAGSGDFGAYAADVIRVARETAPDLLIPCSDSALRVVVEREAELRLLCAVAAPPARAVRMVLDKDCTMTTAAAHGVPVPRTYDIPNIDALDRVELQYPVVAKPRDKSKPGGNLFKARYYFAPDALRAEFVAKPSFGLDHLIQRYHPGHGVGIGALISQGNVLAVAQHRRLTEYPSSGGVAVTAVSEAVDPTLAGHALRLLRALEWEGVAMVEFKRDPETGDAVLMEVNGRFWGSIALAIASGIDFPRHLWEATTGRQCTAPASSRPGVRFRWSAGELRRLAEVARDASQPGRGARTRSAMLAFVRHSVSSYRDALWRIDDPLPAIAEFGSVVLDVGSGMARSMIGRLLPRRVKETLREVSDLPAESRPTYLRRLVRRTFGVRDAGPPLRDARSFLVLCHGNIMRSPTAAAMLRRRFGERVIVKSAGLHARPSRPAEARAIIAAEELGLSLSDHGAAPVTPEAVEGADVIIVMDYRNEATLLTRFPAAANRVVLLGQYRPSRARNAAIPDPYHGTLDDVRHCFADIRACVDNLPLQLDAAPAPSSARVTELGPTSARLAREGSRR